MHRGGEGTRPMTTACAGFRRGKKTYYYELQQAGNKSDVKNKNVKKAQAQIWLVPFLLSHDIRDFRFMVEISLTLIMIHIYCVLPQTVNKTHKSQTFSPKSGIFRSC